MSKTNEIHEIKNPNIQVIHWTISYFKSRIDELLKIPCIQKSNVKIKWNFWLTLNWKKKHVIQNYPKQDKPEINMLEFYLNNNLMRRKKLNMIISFGF